MEDKHLILEKLMFQPGNEQKQSIFDCANVLGQQSEEKAPYQEKALPKLIERPSRETLTEAIVRLKNAYFMLDVDDLLNDVSTLMSRHILQGLEVSVAIDELQTCFQSYYNRYLDND